MTLEQVQQTLLILLNKANKSGAFELEEANAGIQALNALAQLINQLQQAKQATGVVAMDATADDGNGLPHDPSKP